MNFGRGRFRNLVERQLDLFEEDEGALLDEARAADARWTHAAADESEERYGEYQLVVDAVGEHLHDIRETYAATLDDSTAADYRTAFDRQASRRFPRFVTALLEEEG